MRRWLDRALPALVGAGAFLLLVAPVLDPAVQLFYRDTGRLYYPVKKYIADRLARGELALWDPWTEAGVSLLGQTTPALLHPMTALYAVLPFDLAFKLNHLLGLLIAGIGGYLLARRIGASRFGALTSGLVYGGSGYLVSMAASNLPFVLGPATVPLALNSFLAFSERPRFGRLAAAGLLLALCGYAGDPQSMLMAGLIGSAWVVVRALASARTPAGRAREAARGAGLAGAWAACALGLAAPMALPAAAMLARSARAQGLTAWERGRFFVAPARLPGLVLPRAFDDAPELSAVDADELRSVAVATPFSEYFGGNEGSGFTTTMYLGGAALLLALFAGTTRRGRFALGGGLLFLLASTGDSLGFQEWLFRLVPGFSLFRYAEKLLAPASLLLAVAAGLGLDAALLTRRRAMTLASGAALIGLALLAGSAVLERASQAFATWLVEVGHAHSASAAHGFAELLPAGMREEAALLSVLALVALVAALRPGWRSAPLLLALTCAASLLIANGPHLSTISVDFFRQTPPLAVELGERAGPSAGRWRIYVQPDGMFTPGTFDPKSADSAMHRAALRPQYEGLYGIEGVGDFFSASDTHYAQVVSRAGETLLPLLMTRFVVVMPRSLSARKAKELGFRPSVFGLRVQELRPSPRAWIVDRVRVARSLDETVDWLRAPGFNPWREAIVLSGGAPGEADPRSSPRAGVVGRIQQASPEHLSLETTTTAPALAVLSQHFDPGWSAQVNGDPARVVEVDGALPGVHVPRGQSQLSLRFRPVGLTSGLVVAAATIVLLAFGRRLTGLVNRMTNFVRLRFRPPAAHSGD